MSISRLVIAARRALIEFAIPLAVITVVIGVGQVRSTASAAPAPGSDGSVAIASETNDSTSPVTLTASPVPANCPGDSASDGFTVSAFIVPSGTAIDSITFGGTGPEVPAYPLLTTSGTPHVNIATAPNTGQIINQPPYGLAFYPEGLLPDGDYVIGYACHKDQVAEAWFTQTITITNTGGGAGFSFEIAESTLNAPEAPAIDSVTPGNGVLIVAFTPAATGDAADEFEVRATAGEASITATGTESPLTITGLTNGTTYDVTVVGANAAGTGAESAVVQGTPTEPAAEAPEAPSISSVTPGDGALTVAFAAGGGGDPTSFTVTASDGVDTFSEQGSASPITVDGLENGTEYDVTVVATNDVGTSDPSDAEQATPEAGDALAPTAPTIDSVDVGDGQVTVSFTPGDDAEGIEYTVTAADASASSSNALAATQTATGTESPITVTGLDNDIAYVISLTASNGAATVTVEAATQVTPTASGGSSTGGTTTGGTTTGSTTTGGSTSGSTTGSTSTGGSSTSSSTSGGRTIPATGTSSTLLVAFWAVIVLMVGRMLILLPRTPRVVSGDR